MNNSQIRNKYLLEDEKYDTFEFSDESEDSETNDTVCIPDGLEDDENLQIIVSYDYSLFNNKIKRSIKHQYIHKNNIINNLNTNCNNCEINNSVDNSNNCDNCEINNENNCEINNQKEYVFEIEIPLENILLGKSYLLTVGNTKYNLQIPKGCKELEKLLLTIDEGLKKRNLQIQIKYHKNKFFKRIGNDLIGKFIFSKELQNQKIILPYLIDNIQLNKIKLENNKYEFENLGFYENGKYGKYIVFIDYK